MFNYGRLAQHLITFETNEFKSLFDYISFSQAQFDISLANRLYHNLPEKIPIVVNYILSLITGGNIINTSLIFIPIVSHIKYNITNNLMISHKLKYLLTALPLENMWHTIVGKELIIFIACYFFLSSRSKAKWLFFAIVFLIRPYLMLALLLMDFHRRFDKNYLTGFVIFIISIMLILTQQNELINLYDFNANYTNAGSSYTLNTGNLFVYTLNGFLAVIGFGIKSFSFTSLIFLIDTFMVITVIWKVFEQYKFAFLYILLPLTVIGMSAGNFGTLSRYRIDPIWISLCFMSKGNYTNHAGKIDEGTPNQNVA